MSKKFFSLFLSTVLIACVAFAVISVARMVVSKPNDWDNTEPVKIVEKGSSYKHYYDSLSTVQKHTYNQILKNIYSMPEKIEIPSVDDSDIEKVFTALIDDNPDLYLPPVGTLWCDFNSRFVPDDGYCFWGYEEKVR